MSVEIPCVCPPKADGEPRHIADTVDLRERLDFRSALAARNAIILLKQDDPDASAAEVLAVLTETYLISGIESWTLTDDKGKKLEPNRQNIRAFMDEHPSVAMDVGDEADALYAEAVMLPLVARAQKSLQPMPTTPSTSPKTGSRSTLPKPSKPSSTSTSRTAGTGTTSSQPAGVSN